MLDSHKLLNLYATDIFAEFYQPVERWGHASVLVDEKIYIWAGRGNDMPEVHSSEMKLRATSYVDVFHCRLGM